MMRQNAMWRTGVLLGLLVWGPHSVEAQDVRHNASPYSVTAEDLAGRIHVLVNAERKKAKLGALKWNKRLAAIATGHSRDMADRHFFSHDSPEGRDFGWRYQQAGFKCAIRVGKIIHAGAENLALARLYNASHTVNQVVTYDWNSPDTIAIKAVEGWMRSPGHRKNILTAHWRQQGIGVVIAAENRILITQNFC